MTKRGSTNLGEDGVVDFEVIENLMDRRNGNSTKNLDVKTESQLYETIPVDYVNGKYGIGKVNQSGKEKYVDYNTYNIKDEDWHELQMSRGNILKLKIDEYANSFTMHGLTKVITGKNIESLFWFMILFSGLVTCFVVIHGLITKYRRYEIYTEIRAVIADDNFFPAITFCENTLFLDNYFAYCGSSPRPGHANTDVFCNQRVFYNKTGSIRYKEGSYWTNGLFNITHCRTMGGKNCLNHKYIRTMFHYNHSCFTWNYAGNLSDIYSHVTIQLDFNNPHWLHGEETIVALPHDPRAHEVDITKQVKIQANKEVEIKLDKTIIKRLPSPYPSTCSDDKGEDIFPGKYTRRSCIESHNFIRMYEECGDTLDYIQQFIPEKIKNKYAQNRTIAEAARCIWEFGARALQSANNCGFPCNDYELSVIHSFNEKKKMDNKTKYKILIQFQKVDTYQTIEEKVLYTWDQMLSEMGGLIGLIIGASVISVVEVIVYLFLVFLKKCCCYTTDEN